MIDLIERETEAEADFPPLAQIRFSDDALTWSPWEAWGAPYLYEWRAYVQARVWVDGAWDYSGTIVWDDGEFPDGVERPWPPA